MLLFTQSREIGFALSITKLKDKIHFRDHRNSAIDIVADTISPVTTKIDGKLILGEVTGLASVTFF